MPVPDGGNIEKLTPELKNSLDKTGKQKDDDHRDENIAPNTNETTTFLTCTFEKSQKEQAFKDNRTECDTLLVNGQVPDKILIQYTRSCFSAYDGYSSSLSTYSMEESERLSGQRHDDINGILNEFKVTSIRVGEKTFLDKHDEGLFTFPQTRETDGDSVILHGPSDIFGTEDDGKSIIIGVVTKEHNKGTCCFTWYNTGHIYSAGIDQCFVRITEPGIYNVTVEYNGTAYTFESPCVVLKTFPHEVLGNRTLQGPEQAVYDGEFKHADSEHTSNGHLVYSSECNIEETF